MNSYKELSLGLLDQLRRSTDLKFKFRALGWEFENIISKLPDHICPLEQRCELIGKLVDISCDDSEYGKELDEWMNKAINFLKLRTEEVKKLEEQAINSLGSLDEKDN
jgi:hypothetical protein